MSVPPDVPSYAPQYRVKEQKPERTVKPANTFPEAKFVVAGFSLDSVDSRVEFGDITIPDFHGKSLREVTEECLKSGLRLQSVGSGAAVEQMPPAGASVRAGARMQVRFSTRAPQR